jgi:hypothetical protein
VTICAGPSFKCTCTSNCSAAAAAAATCIQSVLNQSICTHICKPRCRATQAAQSTELQLVKNLHQPHTTVGQKLNSNMSKTCICGSPLECYLRAAAHPLCCCLTAWYKTQTCYYKKNINYVLHHCVAAPEQQLHGAGALQPDIVAEAKHKHKTKWFKKHHIRSSLLRCYPRAAASP